MRVYLNRRFFNLMNECRCDVIHLSSLNGHSYLESCTKNVQKRVEILQTAFSKIA